MADISGYTSKKRSRTPHKRSFISVVIPVYNDPEGIKTTLESLLGQDYSRDLYEVIVVDNNSSDNTPVVVEEFVKKYPKGVKFLVEKDIQSSYAARNKGISASRGEIIAFIDADMWADENWLSSTFKAFRNSAANYVSYNIRVHTKKETLVGLYSKFTDFPTRAFMERGYFGVTAGIAVSKALFRKIGLFDSRLISGGDLEFGDRCRRSGAKQIFIEQIMLHHPARESFSSIVKRDFRIGRGHRRLVELYPDRLGRVRRDLKLIPYISPKRFKKKIRRNQALSRSLTLKENVCFYLLSICQQTVTRLGYFYEASCQGIV